jgi:hypothetical protein
MRISENNPRVAVNVLVMVDGSITCLVYVFEICPWSKACLSDR